ncbi:hypothetical protein FIU94_13390 [Sulfitobacter sp. THAF37]|uniref:hypothetical protein n=1 Tax=Sulfitobacter sp. THAF37 TaxID=2587855 RepID=UPI0012A8C14B|nr:hypothetical protein [Sulfitobacter sp. THAF37]QFT59821.1 hypothetical protein FIU94_13390 [Sulfitobacter sp. THAF37]
MMGVVLWSDPVERKAVFWCEDQGDLAFYQADWNLVDGASFLEAGDMVTFKTETCGRLRRARDVTTIEEDVCKDLPVRLRDTSSPSARHPQRGSNIIAFGGGGFDPATQAPGPRKRKV